MMENRYNDLTLEDLRILLECVKMEIGRMEVEEE